MNVHHLVAGLVIAMVAMPTSAKTLPPRDECLHIEGYFQLRQQLESIVAARDAKRLLALAVEDLRWSFGDSNGKASFAAKWKLTGNGKASPIWKEFDRMLPLGCGVQGGGFAFPHLFTVDVSNEGDVFSLNLVLGHDINLRAAPSSSSPQLTKLSWELVEVIARNSDKTWSKVKIKDGRVGWIRSDYLRSSVDYRAGFERRNGAWRLALFVAGD